MISNGVVILENSLKDLANTIKKQDFLVYFRKLSFMKYEDEKMIIGLASNFMKDNIELKFKKDLEISLKKYHENSAGIILVVDDEIDNPQNKNVIDCTQITKNIGKIPKQISKDSSDEQFLAVNNNKSSQRYTLQNFIVGQDNQLAHSACEAVSRNPGKAYNPLYIYGDVGLGKTHLLQATGLEISKKFKDKRVIYTTTDQFITEYVTSVKKRSIDKLRQKFREVDVLVIDDVQFLAGKDQTQNEVYNIFNLLYDDNKQIIISGDRAPKELTELEPRLRSRFEWGITIDIGKPDYETRLAILQEKAREKEFMIPQDVAEFIALNVSENVRELEGILNQMIAEYELDSVTPTLPKIAQRLKKLSFTTDFLGKGRGQIFKTKIKSYEDILDAVSNHFGIEKEGILGENRKKEFMIPRQVAMYLLKTKMNYTYERIGNIFSGRNHAAVLYSCNKLEKLMKKDNNLVDDVDMIKDTIGI